MAATLCSRIAVPFSLSHYHSLSFPIFRHGGRLRRRLPLSSALFKVATLKASSSASHSHPQDNLQQACPSLPSPSFQALSPRQKDQISLYVATLLKWNQKMNLTAVREESEVMTRHVEDSLAIIPPLRRSYCGASSSSSNCQELSVVDVGSGAGLPGIILAIACPGWKITLLESMQKRCSFLEHVVALAGLSNVRVVRERAENAGQSSEFRESYDVAVARAVAEMRILAEYCLPFVRVGGLFVAAKGYDPQEEIRNAENAIKLMGASVLELCPVESYSMLGQRTVVICLKGHATPRRYPRQPGIPSKLPL